MNEKLNGIFARRSVRRFTGEPVSETAVQDLLEAAMAAPSACAKDPWHFVVVTDATVRDRMADGLPNGQLLRGAAAGILVCGDQEQAHDRQESYLLQDCSAAIENLLLAATALGLGACWLGVHPRSERMDHMRQLFSLPAGIIPVAVVAVGEPAQAVPARTRFAANKVHPGRW